MPSPTSPTSPSPGSPLSLLPWRAAQTSPAGAPVDVVLPCLDEAAALPGVLAGLPGGWRAIVVDNGSSDASATVAQAHGADVISEPLRGFGAACAAGLAAATAPIVAFCDADGSLDLGELTSLVEAVRAGASERPVLALGRRRPTSARAWPWHARLGNAVLAGQLRRRAGVPLHDLGPMRAAPRAALLALGLQDRRFGYPLEMVLRAAAAGWCITEREVTYRPRIGRSKVTGTVRGTLAAISDMSAILAQAGPR
jgi:glycosyltransferase involved in cell wall biosynthesis